MGKRFCDWGRGLVTVALLVPLGGACASQSGYIKTEDLEEMGRGPSACRKSCEELGMRMAALVLVGKSIPGCVCEPTVQGAPAQPNAPAANAPTSDAASPIDGGAAASTTGYVVLAAAAAARQQQEQQMQAQQRQNK